MKEKFFAVEAISLEPYDTTSFTMFISKDEKLVDSYIEKYERIRDKYREYLGSFDYEVIYTDTGEDFPVDKNIERLQILYDKMVSFSDCWYLLYKKEVGVR